MPKANFRPFNIKGEEVSLHSSRPWRSDGQPPCASAVRRAGGRGNLLSRYPRVTAADLHPLGCKTPQHAADFIKREAPERYPSPTRPTAGATGAAVPFPLPEAARLRRRLQPNPPPPNPGRWPTWHLRFARENHPSACESQAARGTRLRDHGRHGRGNPSSTDALFIRRFSIRFSIPRRAGGGGRLSHPLPRPPKAGEPLQLSPVLTPTFWVGILPGKRPHPSSEQNHESFILTQEN